MATIIYKKFFKKSPSQPELCEHQRPVANIEDGFTDTNFFAGTGPNNISDILDRSKCSICNDEQKAMKTYRLKLMTGLFLPFLVQSLDTTIIASALPFIASDFHQLSQLNWIVSASNLTSSAFIPLWGQFADVFGRYAAIQSALGSMVFGSIFCSAAPTNAFPMLLVGRAFQGIGCAGLLINTKMILADKVSLKENAKNNIFFTVVGGVGYGIGPVLGGYLTDVNWRWCFIINIPIGVAGLVLTNFVLRSELLGPQKITRTDGVEDATLSQTFSSRLRTIDFGGQFLFLFGMGLLVLALTWAGSSNAYTWTSASVLAPLIIGIILVLLFLLWEYQFFPEKTLSLRSPTVKPMIPTNLLFTRNAGLLIYINLIAGMAMYAVFYFISLYFSLVRSYGPGKSGQNLLYCLPGLAGGAYLAILMCNRYPLQTWFPLFLGTVLEPLGITLLAVGINTNHLPLIYGMLVLTGVGTGIRAMPGTLHGVGYFPTQIASIVSLMSLAVSLGGTLATTIMLNIFNNELRRGGISLDTAGSSSFDAIEGLPVEQQAFLREKALRGIVVAFFGITSFMWLGVGFSLGLGNVRIGKDGRKDEVLERGSYVGSLIWGRKGKGMSEGSG